MAQADSILDEYERCWNEHRLADLETFWDLDEQEPIYVAEESPVALIGWEAIRGYWRETRAALPRIGIRSWARETRRVAPGVMLLHYAMHWNAEVPGGAIGGDVRVSALLREREGRHLFFHYVEAPVGALPMIRRVYAAAVDPGWRRPS